MDKTTLAVLPFWPYSAQTHARSVKAHSCTSTRTHTYKRQKGQVMRDQQDKKHVDLGGGQTGDDMRGREAEKKVSVETERVKRCKDGQRGQRGGHGVR